MVVTLAVVLVAAALGMADKLDGEMLGVLLGSALPAAALSRRGRDSE